MREMAKTSTGPLDEEDVAGHHDVGPRHLSRSRAPTAASGRWSHAAHGDTGRREPWPLLRSDSILLRRDASMAALQGSAEADEQGLVEAAQEEVAQPDLRLRRQATLSRLRRDELADRIIDMGRT
jgi:hypothetical protein